MRVETFRTIIVPAAIAAQCRQLAASWPGGDGMFITPLYSIGQDPTHYISSGFIDQAVANAIDNPEVFAGQAGIPVEMAQALRSAMHVSTRQDVHAELSEIGLSLTDQ